MSEMYTRADLRHVAEYMIDDLRECQDGTVTTTAELAANQGYNIHLTTLNGHLTGKIP